MELQVVFSSLFVLFFLFVGLFAGGFDPEPVFEFAIWLLRKINYIDPVFHLSRQWDDVDG